MSVEADQPHFEDFVVKAVSVEAAIDVSVDELSAGRASRIGDRYGKLRLSTSVALRAADFAVLPTFTHPHFDVALPDLSEVTVAQLGLRTRSWRRGRFPASSSAT